MDERLSVHREFMYKSVSDKEYLITHGDMFDTVTITKKMASAHR